MFLQCLFLCRVLIPLIFIKIGLKLSYFCQKETKLLSAGGPVPRPSNGSQRLGGPPTDPRNSSLTLQISGYAPHAVILKEKIGFKLELRN